RHADQGRARPAARGREERDGQVAVHGGGNHPRARLRPRPRLMLDTGHPADPPGARIPPILEGFVKRAVLAALLITAALLTPVNAAADPPVRFATFNTSLNRPTEGPLPADSLAPHDPHARATYFSRQRLHPH